MPGMIVAPQPAAVEEGAKVLAAGGNAVDAAVTCAFVQFVVDPHSCGVGGYAILNAHLAGQPTPNVRKPARCSIISGAIRRPVAFISNRMVRPTTLARSSAIRTTPTPCANWPSAARTTSIAATSPGG